MRILRNATSDKLLYDTIALCSNSKLSLLLDWIAQRAYGSVMTSRVPKDTQLCSSYGEATILSTRVFSHTTSSLIHSIQASSTPQSFACFTTIPHSSWPLFSISSHGATITSLRPALKRFAKIASNLAGKNLGHEFIQTLPLSKT